MPELSFLNAQPVNKVCRAKLIEAGEFPNPNQLHVLDLATWGTMDEDDGGAGIRLEILSNWELSSALNSLITAKPNRVYKLLIEDRQQDEEIAEQLKEMTPAEAAQDVLERIAHELIPTLRM